MPTLSNFECELLSSSPIIAFVAADHRLAKAGRMTLAQLTGHALVLRERGSKTRMKLEVAAKAAGVELMPVVEAEGREAVREIVASGVGIGFVSLAEFGDDHRLVPIRLEPEEQMIMDEALICLQERRNSKLVKVFFRSCKTACGTFSSPLDRDACTGPMARH
jgi:DNA-binding transcriptional LysR family regulator